MGRIKAFRFRWTDAWHSTEEGYDTILETSDNGNIKILFLVNSKPYNIVLTDREDDFIQDMSFLKNWDKKEYSRDVIDGTLWSLHFTYDDTIVVSKGSNGFPPDFPDLLDLLHRKYKIPKAKLEDEKTLEAAIKGTKIIENPDIDSHAMYY